MTKTLVLLLTSFFLTSGAFAETAKVCHDVKKNGKTVQECKNIKVHKKLEGEKVPEDKKKK